MPIKNNVRTVSLKPELVKLAGDVVVGVLLSQLYYWCVSLDKKGQSKLRVEREGKLWAAKPMKELLEETGLTRKQYLRAVKVLTEKQLIEVRLFKSRCHEGLTVNHWRVTLEALEEPKELVPKGDNPMSPNGTTGCTLSVQPNKEAEITTDTTSRRTGVNAKPGTPPQERIGGEVKLEDLKKNLQGKTVQSLEGRWQEGMKQLTHQFQKPLTAKNKGQLKQISNILQNRARETIDYVLQNWWKFAQEAKAKRGLETIPTEPHLGFLLKYCDIALNLFLQSIAEPAVPAPINEVPSEKPVEIVKEEEKAHHLTDIELQEMLDGLKE